MDLRTWLETNGAELTPDEMGSALVELLRQGLDQPDADERGRLDLGLFPGFLAYAPVELSPRHLADEFQRFASRFRVPDSPTRYGLAVAIHDRQSAARVGIDEWLLRTIAASSDVGAVHVVTAPATPRGEFLWPLDVAVARREAEGGIFDVLEGLHWKRFVTPVRLERAVSPLELLLYPGSLREAIGTAVGMRGLPRIQIALVLRGTQHLSEPVPAAEGLRSIIGADAVAVVDIVKSSLGEFLDQVFYELSHDVDFDVALTCACQELELAAPILIGAHEAFSRAHGSAWARAIPRALVDSRAVPKNGGRATVEMIVGHEDAAPDEIADAFERRLPELSWGMESHAATETAEVGRLAREASRKPSLPIRFVQARLLEAGDRSIQSGPLRQHCRYALETWIGPIEAAALIAPTPFPAELLPPAKEHYLTIALTAPSLESPTQTRRLVLPREGPSEAVRFDFTPTREGSMEARLAVLHGNRVLQTLLLRYGVGEGASERLEILTESVLRRDMSRLDSRRRFDAAVLFNDLGDEATMSVFAGDSVSLVQSDVIENALSTIGGILEDATNQPRKYGKPGTKRTDALLANWHARAGSYNVHYSRCPRCATI